MRGKRKGRSRLSLFLAAMLACAATQNLAFSGSAEAAEQETADRQLPANPEHHCVKDGAQTDATDWDVICFGSYPQGEVTELTDEIANAAYDANGDALVDGVKYRRIGKKDAASGAYFGDGEYRYFKWEPIRWRVLENDGETLLVVADKGLDCKKYYEIFSPTAQPWAESDLRNWLNGEFYQTAFDSGEQEGIVAQTIKEPREDASKDNIWLLSREDALNPAYGFCGENENSYSRFSDRSSTRWMQASDYAHARGAYAYSSKFEKENTDCCRWWLRAAGSLFAFQKQYVTNFGSVVAFGVHTAVSRMACVPALRLSVSSPFWSYAGRESSLKEEGGGTGGVLSGDGPVHHCTKKNDGTDWTEWSYYEFGSYPQGEVTDPAITALIDASCDENGDALVGGAKYRRVSKSDGDSLSFGDAEYRYFKWEPIRWRILKKEGGKMLLLSDRVLSVCRDGEDMSGHLEKFYQDAFSESERRLVEEQSLLYDMEPYFDSDSVKETKEKVFLLSVEDVVNADYGFCEDPDTFSASRQIEYTDYLGAITWSKYDDGEHSDWSLRSKAYTMGNASVDYTGWIDKMYGGSGSLCAPAVCLNTSPDSGTSTGSCDYKYVEKEDGTIRITGYIGSDTEIEIPAVTDEGKQVTEVYLTEGCEDLTKITIPEGVECLDKWALKYCENLVSISLPASMTQIGDSDEDYEYDETIEDNRAGRPFDGLSKLEEIHVASGNTRYSSENGILCTAMRNAKRDVLRVPEGKNGTVEIPGDVEKVRLKAFQGCGKITEVSLSGETYLSRNGFKGCSNLKTIRLCRDYTGQIVKRLENDDAGVGYFYSCTKFEEYVVEESNPDYFSKDGILYGGSGLVSCPVAKSGDVVVPSGITRVWQDAFGKCAKVETIVLPDGVTVIYGNDPYGSGISGCSNLRSVEIPASMKEIGLYTFSGCDSLKDIYFKGTKDQWNQIVEKDVKNRLEFLAVTVHCIGEGGSSDAGTGGGTGEKPAERISVSESWVTLSETEVTYNGKPQTPSVTVRDGSGHMIGAANYAVTYSGNKNVGEASVTVTFRGNYEGTVVKKFSISPKGTSIRNIKAGRKSFTVTWRSQKAQTAGYEIRYSANKKMKKAVLVKKIRAKKTSRKISGLKAKKTYYVQIRTYQTANGKKYVSKWSAAKKVKTKK